MIKVLIDHQKFSSQKYGGISRYFSNIIDGIEGATDFDYELGLLYTENQYLKVKNPYFNNRFFKALLHSPYNKRISKLNQAYCEYLLSLNNFDIFHPTYYDPYFFKRLRKPFISTIHDMINERVPEYFWAQDPLIRNKRLNIERADLLIAISNTTRNDLLKYSDADPAKVHVVHQGIDIDSPLITREVDDIPSNYLLYVGDRAGYKNFFLFIRAFKLLQEQYPELNVVLTGGGKLGTGELEIIRQLKLERNIVHRNVTDEELNFLYSKAVAFVYPSLHEGFGLPILEAFRAGCPVILSDTECFREVADHAALYFDKHSVESFHHCLHTFISDSSLRNELVQKGLERVKKFPLSACIEQTLRLYSSMA